MVGKYFFIHSHSVNCIFVSYNEMQISSAGASPRILEWGGRIVGRVANLPQNTVKIEKTPDLGHFILESGGGGGRTTRFSKVRGSGPPNPPVGDAPLHQE